MHATMIPTACALMICALANTAVPGDDAKAPAVKPAAAQTPSAASPLAPARGSVRVPAEGAAPEAEYQYRLVEPPVEALANGARVPLIVFLHGAGERGSDNEAQLKHFVRTAATPEFQRAHPCFVLAMQCPATESWVALPRDAEGHISWSAGIPLTEQPTRAMHAVQLAMDALLRSRPIDPRRVYLTGLSMGGFGSFDLGAREPERFAAIVAICGGGDTKAAATLARVPLFIVHGADDPVVPANLSTQMAEAVRAAGGTVEIRILPKTGHDSWSWAYQFGTEGALDWMFAQHASASPALAF